MFRVALMRRFHPAADRRNLRVGRADALGAQGLGDGLLPVVHGFVPLSHGFHERLRDLAGFVGVAQFDRQHEPVEIVVLNERVA